MIPLSEEDGLRIANAILKRFSVSRKDTPNSES